MNMKNKAMSKRKIDNFEVIITILLLVWVIIIFVPFYNLIITSFASAKEVMKTPLMLFPKEPTFENYKLMLNDPRILMGYRTTLVILLIGLPVNILLTTMTAFALSNRDFPGRKFFFLMILFSMFFSGGIIPTYLIVRRLGLIGSLFSVILLGGMTTFYMIIMRNYFMSIPQEMADSARIDGASEWTYLARIVIPISKPIIATITLFYAVDRWNEWFNAMLYMQNSNWVPLQQVLRSIIINPFTAADDPTSVDTKLGVIYPNGVKMASVIVVMLPIMCFYPFVQKHFTKGVLTGAIKG